MVNDEVNNKAMNIEIKVAQYSAKTILKAMKKIIEDAAEKSQPLADYISEKGKTNSRKLKDMVKKGQLENIDLQKGEVKELKNQLNRYGVNFSVMNNKESGLYSVFFQAKDTKAVDLAFKKAIERYEKKENKRDSTYDDRKTYGQVVTFRTPFAFQDAIRDAFSLYSNGGGNFVTAPDYKEAKRRFEDAAAGLLQFQIVDDPEVEVGYESMKEFLKAFQKFDKANAAVMVYSDYTDEESYFKNIIDEDQLKEYMEYYEYLKALIGPDGDPSDDEFDLLDINYQPISISTNIIDYSYLTSLIQEKANSRGEMNHKNNVEIEKTLAELIKQNPAKGEVYRQIIEEIDQNPDKYHNAIIDEVAKDKFNTIIQANIDKFADNYKVNKEDLEFLIANYPIDKKEVKKPLGEDKLIKNANKDLYNEASGENLSLLKFKSMLRKDTHKFINQKIRPYFD